jgi:integrase
MLPERHATVGRVLTTTEKELLFQVAGSQESWTVAHCAAVLAVSTTCRGVELKHLRWQDIDLLERQMVVRRSKTEAGHRIIPLNTDAMAALSRLRKRSEAHNAAEPEHPVFPACKNERIDPSKRQKTWRTAWRSLTKATAKKAGEEAEKVAAENGADVQTAREKAAAIFAGLRFHDLRHQAITELAERGASDATLMALSGHMSRAMTEHYSHARMAAKRSAVEALTTGSIQPPPDPAEARSSAIH